LGVKFDPIATYAMECLAHKELPPPPQDHRRALGTGLLKGPRRRKFPMSEVPL